jgi:hypothetical protein
MKSGQVLRRSNLFGFNRTPAEQAIENLSQALRALDLVPAQKTDLMPHPLMIVRAEIENARLYLREIERPSANIAS